MKISGSVETLVNISPRAVRLTGNVFRNSNVLHNNIVQNIEMTVKITPVAKYPFSIKSLKLNDGTNISAEFRLSNIPSGSWDIIVKNIREKAGRYFDEITLKTDSGSVPEIKINVFGNITD